MEQRQRGRGFKKLMAGLVASGMLLASCGGGASAKDAGDTIRIGANFELSGAVSSYGSTELEGVKLAVKEINEADGVNGKKFELVELDNKSDAAEVASVATRLVTQEKVVAMIGPATTGNAKASIPAATEGNIPLIAPSATADDVTVTTTGEVQKQVFRICFKDSFQGAVMAKFVAENVGAKKVAIIGDNSSDYAKELSKEFEAAFKGEVAFKENYTAGDTDFSAIATSLKGKDFDAVFIPGYYAEAGLIIKQLRESGITAPVVGADGFDSPELASIAGAENLNDVFYSAHFSTLLESEKVASFIKSFEEEYGKSPNAFAALAYDGMYMLKEAIEAGGTDSDSLLAALEATKDFDGVTGTITVNEAHDAVKSATVVELKDGKEYKAVEVNV